MTFHDYVLHYFAMPDFLIFFAVSLIIVVLIHFLLLARTLRKPAGQGADLYLSYQTTKEQYYELVFAASSTLLFTGIYFMLDFRWIPLPAQILTYWDNYSDVLLLILLILSIVLINLMDRVIIPLEKLDASRIGALRMASMIYMLVVFAYIKFIYEDNNYDTILFYFITMLVSRFVYMDASLDSFRQACRDFLTVVPILLLVLLSTALLALYGFRSDYLLTSNGVVTSLFLAHCFMMAELFLLTLFEKITHFAEKLCRKKSAGKNRPNLP